MEQRHARLPPFRGRMRIPIFPKLAALLAAVVLLTAALLSGTLALEQARGLEAGAMERSVALSRAVGSAVEEHLDGSLAEITAFADDPGLAQLLESGKPRGLVARLDTIRRADSDFLALTIVDPAGQVVAASPDVQALRNLDYSAEPHFQRALAGEPQVIGPPRAGAMTGAPVLPLAAPVRAEDGRVVAVLAAGLSLRHLGTHVTTPALGERGIIQVLDADGIVVGHSGGRRLLARATAADSVGVAGTGETATGRVVADDGVDMLAAATRVPGLGWSVEVQVPTADVFRPVAAALWRNATLSVLVAALVSALSLPIARRVTAPLSALGAAAHRVAEGRFDEPLPRFRTGDEREDLAADFALMQGQLAARDRRQQETLAALEASESQARLLALVASHARNSVVITDADGRIEWVNDGFTRATGYALDEVAGRTPGAALQGPDSDPGVVESMRASTRRGEPFTAEIVNYRKDGEPFWSSIEAAPIRDEVGRVVRFIGVASDVTERRRAEERLRDSNLELERALATANELAVAAQAATAAKSEFLATMSHEIRTPMNGVIGMTSLLLETSLTEEQREYVETVRSCGDQLLDIINDILDFSKVEAGKLAIERVPFDPAQLVRDVVALVGRQAAAKGLTVTTQVEADETRLLGDEGRLRQVLLNLASNAIKFTETGVVEISAEATPSHADGRLLRFSVTDTGIGIDAATQRRLFEPFVQADSSTTRRYGGTGLGLAICRRLVELMGGRIGVESEPGRGSTFWFSVPLASAERPQAERVGEAAAATTCPAAATFGPGPDGSAPRILVVEDNPVNRRMALNMLARLRYRADAVADGIEALEALGRIRYDLVLLDCQMPRLDGYATAAAIRAGATPDPTIPIIALTASAMPEDRERCFAAGMDDFATKPISVTVLDGLLARWLAKSMNQN